MSAADSTQKTTEHIERVRELLDKCREELRNRGLVHDASKLREPEKSGFDRLLALELSNLTYGSEEYKACLRKEKPAIDHHYANNPHHPEYYPKTILKKGDAPFDHANRLGFIELMGLESTEPKRYKEEVEKLNDEVRAIFLWIRCVYRAELSSINGMNLFDVLEMLMDWKAATERMKNGGNIRTSLIMNIDRFGMSPQLANIFKNTIEYLKW